MATDSLVIGHSRGIHEVSVGDEFWTNMGTSPGRFRVVSFDLNTIYSPVGLGGTPIVECENVRTGEVVRFCGDSVASMLANPLEEPKGWDEEEQRQVNAIIYGVGDGDY